MKRLLVAGLLVLVSTAAATAGRSLEIYFIDVEGGQSTLLVTPEGQSLLVDAGYGPRGLGPGRAGAPGPVGAPASGGGAAPASAAPGAAPAGAALAGVAPDAARDPGRDPARVMAAMRDAGIDRLDFFLATHLHNDHVGGVPELAEKVSIGTFIDYGDPLGVDRMANNAIRAYKPVRDAHAVLQVKPGDRLPLRGLTADVVSASGDLLTTPLPGGGRATPGCDQTEDHPEDGTENYRSVGVMFQFGAFRFLDVGDLSGNTLTRIVCPLDLLGPVSVYLVAHHGDYDSNIPALYAALRPRVAVLNNSATKGGAPEAFRTLHALPALEDLWQLHATRIARNAADDFVANFDNTIDGNWIHLSGREDGSFTVINGRNGFTKTYARPQPAPSTETRSGL